MMFWPILNALAGAVAASILAYKLSCLADKFTPLERVGMGLWGGGMILTIGPILSDTPTPFEDWSGFLIRVGSCLYLIGRLTRHRFNNWRAVRQARRHLRSWP